MSALSCELVNKLDAYSKCLIMDVLGVTSGTLMSNAQKQLLAGLSVH